MTPPHAPQLARQRGAMTLLFSLLLLIGAGMLAFSSGRTSVVEQRIANNEQRAVEAEQAAEAGLSFAASWLSANIWSPGQTAPTPPAQRGASGEVYDARLTLTTRRNGICVRSEAVPRGDQPTSAVSFACYRQTGLFRPDSNAGMPPPLVLGGCLSAAPGAADIHLLDDDAAAIATGEIPSATCLPRGATQVSVWSDQDDDGVFSPAEEGRSAGYSRLAFEGCPDSRCAWKQAFALPFDDAVAQAEAAGHVYRDSIPCGRTTAPGIYLLDRSGTIRSSDIRSGCALETGVDTSTIGAPTTPVLIIVPESAGCLAFSSDIRVYGILYFESECPTEVWQGARIHGSVIWEGGAAPPAAGSTFIQADYGLGSALNARFQVVTGASRIPGTWRDWE